MTKTVGLVILDGWGIAKKGPGNAISLAKIPNFTKYWSLYPHTKLAASGEAVGLPRGEDGNTETGHLSLGAGRIVYQDLPRINLAIADGSFFKNKAFLDAISHIKKYKSNLHLLGLIGSGGVHSNIEHLFALLHLCKEQGLDGNVFLHLITDGRDSPPTSAFEYLSNVRNELIKLNLGKIATIMGRYYAMDRDRRWDRTEKAYLALTQGLGNTATTPEEAIKNAYNQKQTDEFIFPTVITENGKPTAIVSDNDSLIFFNFRIDRPRQLTKAFVLDDFKRDAGKITFDPYTVKYYKRHVLEKEPSYPLFERGKKIANLFFVTMTEYEANLPVAIAFPPQIIDMTLGRVISERGLRQLKVSETEKERFVTFYFNGFREKPFPGEDKLIIPSPHVPTYDLKPEMSALEMTDALIKKINSGNYAFFVVNFANPDMVGHTGVIPAAIKAVETTDECIGKIVNSVLSLDGSCVITADHGNVEEMIDLETGGVDTEHSTNPVPAIIISNQLLGKSQELESGILADVAPTVLSLMGIPKPAAMTGRNLIQNL